jgi:uncharacterized protein DUF1844
MSTLWTPEGERPIRRDPAPTGPSPAGSRGAGPPATGPGGPSGPSGPVGPDGDELTPEDEEALIELQEQLARTPVELVIANHAFGLFELAALHLSSDPPRLPQARLAIDALGALVEGLAGKLSDYEAQLIEGLANLRMAFVQIRATQGQAPEGGGAASPYPGPPST